MRKEDKARGSNPTSATRSQCLLGPCLNHPEPQVTHRESDQSAQNHVLKLLVHLNLVRSWLDHTRTTNQDTVVSKSSQVIPMQPPEDTYLRCMELGDLQVLPILNSLVCESALPPSSPSPGTGGSWWQ